MSYKLYGVNKFLYASVSLVEVFCQLFLRKNEYTRKEWFGIMTLEEALVEIQRLQEIIQQKDRQIEELKRRKNAGRPPQNKKWMKDYQVFAELYEQGIPIAEIAEQVEYSKRTCYRYKSYYDKMNLRRMKNAD